MLLLPSFLICRCNGWHTRCPMSYRYGLSGRVCGQCSNTLKWLTITNCQMPSWSNPQPVLRAKFYQQLWSHPKAPPTRQVILDLPQYQWWCTQQCICSLNHILVTEEGMMGPHHQDGCQAGIPTAPSLPPPTQNDMARHLICPWHSTIWLPLHHSWYSPQWETPLNGLWRHGASWMPSITPSARGLSVSYLSMRGLGRPDHSC